MGLNLDALCIDSIFVGIWFVREHGLVGAFLKAHRVDHKPIEHYLRFRRVLRVFGYEASKLLRPCLYC